MTRRASVGGTVDDLCRACKMVRPHTVQTAVDGIPQRVVCDWCNSHHNFRGGDRTGGAPRPRAPLPTTTTPPADAPTYRAPGSPERESVAMDENRVPGDLEELLRRVIREEAGLTPVAPSDKWVGGELVLRPGRPGLQEKSWPIDGFFKKIVMIRNRLRTLEQQINGADLSAELKLKLQGYITGCYGTLTSFNVFFADEEDRFKGSGQ